MAKKHETRKSLKLWISPEKHAAIKKAAANDRRSMLSWIMILVDKALEDEKAKGKGGR
ncbi:MAG TPA: hypothetical protein VNZ23_18190 [Xanthobacteraceae bacterium]|jgi:hypothetical protein|nr:hypothetical protein [Xanthobacteraceae bacterium]